MSQQILLQGKILGTEEFLLAGHAEGRSARSAGEDLLSGRSQWIALLCEVLPRALLAELGEPLVSSTLLLPGQDEPMTQGWEIAGQLGHAVDAVIDSGDCGTEPTTVIDFSQETPEILRRGAGDTSGFE